MAWPAWRLSIVGCPRIVAVRTAGVGQLRMCSLLAITPQAKEEGLAWPDLPEVNAGEDTLRRRS